MTKEENKDESENKFDEYLKNSKCKTCAMVPFLKGMDLELIHRVDDGMSTFSKYKCPECGQLWSGEEPFLCDEEMTKIDN